MFFLFYYFLYIYIILISFVSEQFYPNDIFLKIFRQYCPVLSNQWSQRTEYQHSSILTKKQSTIFGFFFTFKTFFFLEYNGKKNFQHKLGLWFASFITFFLLIFFLYIYKTSPDVIVHKIIRHFQHLFSVEKLAGVLPKINVKKLSFYIFFFHKLIRFTFRKYIYL